MQARLCCGGGELVGLLQDPHDVAEVWSGSQFEDDPSFAIMNLGRTGDRALVDHDLLEVRWYPEFYPVGAVDVGEGFSADMQLDLFVSMVLHLDAWDEKHFASDHV
jgi:hypothetical protein